MATTMEPHAAPAPEAGGAGQMPTTQWNVVLTAAKSTAPFAAEALEQLCRTYWMPVYAFVRRQVYNPDDARDLTQEFFAHLLESKKLKFADPVRGRFRCFLLASLKNFLAGEWRRTQAKKRGGGQLLISLDELREAENDLAAEPVAADTPPDLVFERRWALALLEKVLARMREKYTAAGQKDYFDALKVFVWGEADTHSQAEVAARLGVTPNALGVAVHRLRRQYGKLLREEIAQTVESSEELADELRHLTAVLAS